MKIHILSDNHAGTHTLAEHGLSYLIDFEGIRILFDAGQSNVFTENATRMGIDLSRTDVKVLSHGHFDHGDGFNYFTGGPLYCHPGVFASRYRNSDKSYIGLKKDKHFFEQRFDLRVTVASAEIRSGIFFLGEIPRKTAFESKKTSFVFDTNEPDFVMDDSALALVMPEGLFVFLGCGHAGVVNILEHAKRVTGINRIHGIIGGFHLKENNEQTINTIKYLEQERPTHIYPSHCTELPALAVFAEKFDIKQVKTGMTLEF